MIFCLCLLGSSGIPLQLGCEAGRRLRVFPGAAGFCPAGVFCFFRCLLSTVYCLLLFGAGSAVRFFGRVVCFFCFLVSGAFVFPRTFLRFCLAVFIIFVNFAVFVNFSDNF